MERSPGLSFSLHAFLLAPWPAAIIGSALLMPPGMAGFSPAAYLVFVAIALAIGYGGLAALVTCLSFIGEWRPVSRTLCAGVGVLLAALIYAPMAYLGWQATGPNSGPPQTSFFAHVLSDWPNPILALFLTSGLGTALVYAFIPWGRTPAGRGAFPPASGPTHRQSQ
jgi:hypothetical protein